MYDGAMTCHICFPSSKVREDPLFTYLNRIPGVLSVQGYINDTTIAGDAQSLEWLEVFFSPRCLGKSRAVRPSVSKAKETTGMYNGPLNV